MMYALGFAAEFLVGFFGGSVADRIDRKRLLMAISLLQVAFICVLPISETLHFFNVGLVFVVAFVLDVCIALYRVADVSIIPQLVKKNDLPKANGYMQMAVSTAEAAGPALAGLLIASLGLFHSLWLNAGTFLLLLTTLSLIRHQKGKPSAPEGKNIWASSVEGLGYTLKNPLFRTLLLWNLFINFGLSGPILMILFHLQEVMALNSGEIGLVMTMSALGGVLSGFVFSKMQSFFRSGRLLLASSVVVSLGFFLFPLQKQWFFSGLTVAVIMFCVGINSRLIHILMQSSVPDHMLGRVISAARLISTVLAPFSVMLAGWAAEEVSSLSVFWAGGALIVSATLLALRTKLRSANWGIRSEVQETS